MVYLYEIRKLARLARSLDRRQKQRHGEGGRTSRAAREHRGDCQRG